MHLHRVIATIVASTASIANLQTGLLTSPPFFDEVASCTKRNALKVSHIKKLFQYGCLKLIYLGLFKNINVTCIVKSPKVSLNV